MKKTLITGAIALSAVALAFAEDGAQRQMPPRPMQGKVMDGAAATGTRQMPKVTTGSSAIDMQVKALRQEMEAKIKAIQEEYNAKIKAVVGDNRAMLVMPDGATTTVSEGRREMNEVRKEMKTERKENRREDRGTSTRPLSGLFDFLKGYFGSAEAEQ